MTRDQMIEALSKSNNEIVAKRCQQILNGEQTIEDALSMSGGFMTSVLQGDYESAIVRADQQNKIALFIYKDDNNLN